MPNKKPWDGHEGMKAEEKRVPMVYWRCDIAFGDRFCGDG